MNNKNIFEIVTTTAGSVSIRNNVVNEIMHNPVGPWVEANRLYIEQSDLLRRAESFHGSEFVIYDVGLGAAANALAALHCIGQYQKKAGENPENTKKQFKIISFECDLTLLKFALENAHHFEHFKGFEQPINQLLEKRLWKNGNIIWQLIECDFPELISNQGPSQSSDQVLIGDLNLPKPHLIFWDPYSPQVNPEMWSLKLFKNLLRICRTPEQGGSDLYTYSQATPIRTALLAAGFYVGQGLSTGLKNETTEVSTDLNHLKNPLAEKWLLRWSRSHAWLPFDCDSSHSELLKKAILNHPQFLKR